MRSDIRTVSIEVAPDKLQRFLADPKNLPRWAIGFAKAIREDQGRWLVTTGTGEIRLRISADNRTVVDRFTEFRFFVGSRVMHGTKRF